MSTYLHDVMIWHLFRRAIKDIQRHRGPVETYVERFLQDPSLRVQSEEDLEFVLACGKQLQHFESHPDTGLKCCWKSVIVKHMTKEQAKVVFESDIWKEFAPSPPEANSIQIAFISESFVTGFWFYHSFYHSFL